MSVLISGSGWAALVLLLFLLAHGCFAGAASEAGRSRESVPPQSQSDDRGSADQRAPHSVANILRSASTVLSASQDDIAQTHCAHAVFCAPVELGGWERARQICRERPLVRSQEGPLNGEYTRRCVNLIAQSSCEPRESSGLAYLYCAHARSEDSSLCSPCPPGSAFLGYGERPCECHPYPGVNEECLWPAPWSTLTCADGLVCWGASARCHPANGPGEACNETMPCATGLLCTDGVCEVADYTTRAACRTHCGAESPCRFMTDVARCVTWPQPGDTCDPDCDFLSHDCVPCAQGARCVEGRCRVVVAPGGTCSDGEVVCVPGYRCLAGRCQASG